MTSLKTIVVDDEPLARKLMMSFLGEFPEIDVVAECGNGRNAISAILELAPDLMFLDIMMPGLNGFEVLKEIKNPPLIIFTTAYSEHALKAFETHAIDYLLKPIKQSQVFT